MGIVVKSRKGHKAHKVTVISGNVCICLEACWVMGQMYHQRCHGLGGRVAMILEEKASKSVVSDKANDASSLSGILEP
jgi:hypothetical protein